MRIQESSVFVLNFRLKDLANLLTMKFKDNAAEREVCHEFKSIPPEVFLGKGVLKIKLISIKLLRTLKSYFGIVFSFKFTAYFQNVFS